VIKNVVPMRMDIEGDVANVAIRGHLGFLGAA
jgi:hypothetical protein